MSVQALNYGFLAALLLGQERTPIAPTPPSTGVVSGRVLRPDGTPVKNAPVVLRASLGSRIVELPYGRSVFEAPKLPEPRRSATTDMDGAFLFEGVDPQARVLLEVDAGPSGVQSKALDFKDRVPGALFPGNWDLAAVKPLSGVLVDAETGSPIADARISLRQGLILSSVLDPEHLLSGGALLYRGEETETIWTPPVWFIRSLRAGAALDERELHSTVRSAPDGSFELPVIVHAFGDATLGIDAPGRPHATVEIDVPDGDRGDAGTIRLQRSTPARIRVVDSKRSPVSGAEVFIGQRSERALRLPSESSDTKSETEEGDSSDVEIFPVAIAPVGSTDSSGKLEALLAPTGATWIAVRARDRTDWTAVRFAERKEVVEIVLREPRSLDVRLVGAGGKPLDGEIVCFPVPSFGPCADLDGYIPMLAPSPVAPGIVSTQSGSARLAGLGGGHHFLLAQVPGHALAAATVVPVLPLEPIQIQLHPLRSRSVRVVGGSGGSQRPLTGARVGWESESPDAEGVLPDKGTVVTDASGRVEILAPEGCTLALEVSHPDFARSSQELGPADVDATVVLRRGGSVTGRILRSGKPTVETLRVALSPGTSRILSLSMLSTRAEGPERKFVFLGVTPGSYRLSVAPDDWLQLEDVSFEELERAERTVVVREDETVEVEIELAEKPQEPAVEPEQGRVLGTVRIGGTRPPLEVRIDCPADTQKKSRYRSREVLPDGTFDLGAVPADEYVVELRIRDPDKASVDLARREIEIAPHEQARIDFDLELGGPVRGLVRSRSTGEPFEGARVRLCAMKSDDPSRPKSWRFTDDQETSEDGSFSWSAIPTGTHWLRILGTDHVPHYARLEVATGVPIDLGEIVLDSPPPVAGRLIVAPSEAYCLRFEFETPPEDLPPRFWLSYDASHAPLAEDSHAFSTRELRPGRYRIRLEDEDSDLLPFRPIWLEVGPGGRTDLVLRFEPE